MSYSWNCSADPLCVFYPRQILSAGTPTKRRNRPVGAPAVLNAAPIFYPAQESASSIKVMDLIT